MNAGNQVAASSPTIISTSRTSAATSSHRLTELKLADWLIITFPATS